MLLLLQSWKVAFRENRLEFPGAISLESAGGQRKELTFFDFLAAFIGARLFA